MPYFKYKAINLDGTLSRGALQALSFSDLQQILYKQERGLIKAHASLPRSYSTLRAGQSIDFFTQLAALLNAGVFLLDALELIEQQTHQRALKSIIHDVVYQVKAGVPFVVALKQYDSFINPLYIHLLNAGEQTGNIASALEQCAQFQLIIDQFYKRIKQALVVPVITLSAFCVIAGLIFTFIIPTFASMLSSVHQELPPATKVIFNLSAFMRSRSFLIYCIGAVIFGYSGGKMINRFGKRYKDKLNVKLPCLGSFYISVQNAYCFQALALLLDGGITQAEAVRILVQAIDNEYIKDKWKVMNTKIKQGISFDCALEQSCLVTDNCVAMIAIGQSSNCFSFMCKQVGERYTESIAKRLQHIISLIQPVLMIVLGLLLTGLIVSVYMPIVQLSMALG